MTDWKCMRAIELTRGKFTIVDCRDYDYVSQFKWRVHPKRNKMGGYFAYGNVCENVNGELDCKMVSMHRIIMECALGRKLSPKELVEHINKDLLDNRRENLKVVGRKDVKGGVLNRARDTKYLELKWDHQQHMWKVGIKVQGKVEHIGYYDTEEKVYWAYKKRLISLLREGVLLG